VSQPVARDGVVVRDFPGLVSNMGPDAPGAAEGAAAEQVNLLTVRPGLLEVRPGTRPVAFDEE
jgi:hypothetical protein